MCKDVLYGRGPKSKDKGNKEDGNEEEEDGEDDTDNNQGDIVEGSVTTLPLLSPIVEGSSIEKQGIIKGSSTTPLPIVESESTANDNKSTADDNKSTANDLSIDSSIAKPNSLPPSRSHDLQLCFDKLRKA